MFVGKGKGEFKNLKELVWTTIFFKNSHKYLVVRRTTRSQFLVVLTQILVVEDTRTREFCYPGCDVYVARVCMCVCVCVSGSTAGRRAAEMISGCGSPAV